jgi:hypothetical protein
MPKTFYFLLVIYLLSWTKTSAQIKPNPMWEKDFVDTCVVIPLGVNFGLCAMPLGWALSDSGCVMLSGCSMIGSNGTDYSTSFFQSSYQCNGACIQDTTVVLACVDSTLIDLNVLCPGIYEPVCGCDSITYSNSCAAMYHGGVVSYTAGPCTSARMDDSWMSEMSILPNPFTDFLEFEITSTTNIQLSIFQANGLEILRRDLSIGFQHIELNQLTSGTYFLRVENSQTGQSFMRVTVKY